MKRTQKHIAMEDKQLNAAESIALISRMIDNTRNRMLRNSGRPFLVWGYVTVFTTLLVMGAVYYFQNPKWNILWMLLPVLGALLMWLTRDKHTEGKVSTFVDRVINNVWLVMGLTAWFVSMLSLFSQIRLPILFIILLTMGMGTTITGLIIRFRPATAGGTAAIVLAPVSLIVSGYWMPTLFAVGFVVMMIIPGHLFPVKRFLRPVNHIFPVSQNAQALGNLQHLIQLVADENQCNSLGFQPGDDIVQRVNLLGCQRRGGLVHNNQLCIQQQCPADRHDLFLTDRELANLHVQIQVNADLFNHLFGKLSVPLLIYETVLVEQVVAHRYILGHGKIGKQGKILIDNLNSRSNRLHRRQRCVLLSLDNNLTAVRRVDAGYDLDQRGFATSVLSCQTFNFAGTQPQLYIVQRLNSLECFADTVYLQIVLAHSRSSCSTRPNFGGWLSA